MFAWVMRFLYCSWCVNKDRSIGPLSPSEVNDAEKFFIRRTQKEDFSEEYAAVSKGTPLSKHSRLLKLLLQIGEEGILRAGRRLNYIEYLPFDVRIPIILPRGNWITKLFVKHYHELGKHVVGTNHILGNLSSKYWIVAAREEIREWERECNKCKRRRAKDATQVMAPLPTTRVNLPLKVFSGESLDFGGPFITIQGRRERRAER